MSFDEYAQKAYGKTPVWLYDITLGSVSKKYTPGVRNVTFDGDTYEAAPGVFHGEITTTRNLKRGTTRLTFPSTNTFARSIQNAGPIDTSVTIRKFFKEDPDEEAVYAFRGRVVSFQTPILTTVLSCEAGFTKLRRKGLSPVIQQPCRHALYSDACGVDRSAFEASLTATDWSAPILTVTGADAQADGYYTGGVVRFDGNLRTVRGHIGTALELDRPLLGLEQEIDDSGSAAIFVAPGCDLSRATCNSRFSNIDNHGGYDWMTEGNPYDGRNIFG